MNIELPYRFNFKPAIESQRELIHNWLQQGYIREWVHGQGFKNLINGLEKFYQYRKEGKGLERDSNITQHWIAYDNDEPFAYLLTSNVFKSPENDYAKYSKSAGLAITLDIFICNKNYLGKGLADTLIKEFLLSKFSDVAEVFIDPEKKNERAVHVYKKVGFKIVGEFLAPWHPVPHNIMKLNMEDLFENSNSLKS